MSISLSASSQDNASSQDRASRGDDSFDPNHDDARDSPAPGTPLDWKRAHAELVELARKNAHLDAEIGRWLLYAARSAAPAWLGFASIRQYAEHLFGFAPRQTQDRLRVAEALERLPRLRHALQHGELCWSVVRELTRTATSETEGEWLAVACNRTAREVEQMVRGRRPGDHPDDPINGEAIERVLRFELAPDLYATVQEALAKVRRDAGGHLDDGQALLLVARTVLGGPADAGRSSYQIAVTMCPNCKRGFRQACGELVELGREAVDMACCDAQHIGHVDAEQNTAAASEAAVRTPPRAAHVTAPTLGAEAGNEVELTTGSDEPSPGRRRAAQTIPPRIRRQVLRRDSGCCKVVGCKNSHFVDVHHCDPRAEGGGHDPTRLITLCGAHHRAVHRGRLIVEGDAKSGFGFRHADGTAYGGAPSAREAEVSVKVFRDCDPWASKKARVAVLSKRSDGRGELTWVQILPNLRAKNCPPNNCYARPCFC